MTFKTVKNMQNSDFYPKNMFYIENNKYKNLSLRNETKINKVWHKEAIYGQARQIISKNIN